MLANLGQFKLHQIRLRACSIPREKNYIFVLFSLLIDLPLGSFPSPQTNLRREKSVGGGRSFFVLVLPAAAAEEVKEEGVWFGWSEGERERQEVTDGCQAQREGGGFDEGQGRAVQKVRLASISRRFSPLWQAGLQSLFSLRQEEEEEERWREGERQEISSPFPLGSTSLCLRGERRSLSLSLSGAGPVTVQRRRRRRGRSSNGCVVFCPVFARPKDVIPP